MLMSEEEEMNLFSVTLNVSEWMKRGLSVIKAEWEDEMKINYLTC
jgi:hypothetical protein